MCHGKCVNYVKMTHVCQNDMVFAPPFWGDLGLGERGAVRPALTALTLRKKFDIVML